MRSRHRDLARLALQSAVAASGAYLVLQATGTGEEFLGVISAVLVLQADRETTLESAGSRVIGTLIGTVVGLAALAVTSGKAVFLSLGLVMLIMGALAAWKPSWRYGIVAAAGLAVGSDASFLETAQNRGIAIFTGAAIGIIVGFFVWPESTRARARRQMGEALSLCRELVDHTLSAALDGRREDLDRLHARFSRAISAARDTSQSIRLGDPDKPRVYRKAVHCIERLWHALIILDRATEESPDEPILAGGSTSAEVQGFQRAACAALGRAERFEPIPDAELDALERSCREMRRRRFDESAGKHDLDTLGLLFGLHEASRNMRDINQAICAIREAG